MIPLARLLRLAAVACVLALPLMSGPVAGRGGDAGEALRLAEELFARDDLPPAEKLYAQVLASSQARDHRLLCYERLLAIYMRSGRYDRAAQHGQKFVEWLRDSDDPARLRRVYLEIGWSYVQLGHYAAAEKPLLEAIKEIKGVAPLPVPQRLTALTLLARGAEARGLKSAGERWSEVEQLATATLAAADAETPPALLNECVWKLSDSYRFQQKHDLAITRLGDWLPTHDRRAEWAGKRETLRLRAGHLAAKGRLADAEKDLQAALEMHARAGGKDRFTAGDLNAELADVLHRAGKKKEAAAARQQAAEHFSAVLKDPAQGKPGAGGVTSAFWKLQALYQHSRQYKAALELTVTQAEAWAGGSLLTPKLRAEQGNLEGVRGEYADARKSLRAAVEELQQQNPQSLIDLPRALINLAVVELATDDAAAAEKLAIKARDLYVKHALKDDLVVVEVYTVLGACAAQNGEYAVAIAHYRDALQRCARIGAPAAPQEANLLLNIALLLKAQGELSEALAYCEKAAIAHARYADPDDLGFAALDAARAGILSAQGKVEAAARLAPRILEICTRNDVTGGPLIVTAKHCFALERLVKGDHGAAEAAWQEVRRLQEKEQQTILLPRTLNYLALSAELQGQWAEAEALYSQAAKLQTANPRAFPVTHFNTLHGLALVLDKRGQPAEARKALGRAIAVVEKARFQVYGDSRQRALYFAQFGPAFDLMVEWCLRDGDVEGALQASVRGRSRTMLDQLQLAGVDPRKSLTGPQAAKYLKREAELRKAISGLRAKAQMLPMDAASSEQAKNLLAAFDEAQQEYSEVWREILNASGVYRALSVQDVGETLAALRTGIIGPKTAVLLYHVGRERSYVFLGTERLKKLEVFPLHVPAAVARNLAPALLPTTEEMLLGGRGLVLKKHKQPDVPPPEKRAATLTPLGHDTTGLLVDHYRNHISDPGFVTGRGFQLKPRDPSQPLPVQPLELMGDMLVPPALRQRLLQAAPANVVIVPDGALHRLPFEALVVQSGVKGRYLLDELPPLAYAPSLAILAEIGKRPPVTRKGLTLLTVGNPAYRSEAGPLPADPVQPDLAHLRSHLPPLPFTEVECAMVRKHFAATAVKALLGKDATEKNVVAAMPGRHVVHLAVHGFADERFGNLFGALAFTPPVPGAEDEDGFLTLYEIYQLPLGDCELAVLSACVTNVGPQLPCEAGVTLASGFLSAGARRVVASHWSVDDKSTAQLMGYFFEEVAQADGADRNLACAAALRKARLRLRDEAGWSSPFYWAPFVVVGPPD